MVLQWYYRTGTQLTSFTRNVFHISGICIIQIDCPSSVIVQTPFFVDDKRFFGFIDWSQHPNIWTFKSSVQAWVSGYASEIETGDIQHCSGSAQIILGIKNTLQWRHNECRGVSNHQPHDCLLYRSFRRKSKKASKLRVTGLCVGNSPVTGEFPAQRASNAENASIWWRHHADTLSLPSLVGYKTFLHVYLLNMSIL